MTHELRRAAQSFFRASYAWKVNENPVSVAAGAEQVSLALASADQELVRVDAAWWDNKPLEPTTLDALNAEFHDAWQTHTGAPERFLELEAGQLRLFPKPLAASTIGLRVQLSVQPSEASAGLPDALALRYRDEIHVGAKARLMLIPGRPWTNPELAAAYGAAFSSLINQAHAKAARGNVRARIAARPNWC